MIQTSVMFGRGAIDLSAITAFIAVGDAGGFRAAGDMLNMTSAGVSKAVARLEAQLGVTLVARTTRSVRLTKAGAAYHARCKAILADLDQASRDITDEGAYPRGRLVVAASRAFGRLRVLPVIVEFARRYPEVEVETRLSDQVVDLVADGVDLAVRIGFLSDSGLIASRISHTGFVLCGSPDYLAAAGKPGHPDDLADHALIGYVAPETARRFTYRFLVDGVEKSYAFPTRLTFDDGEALVAAAVRSAGLVMANDYLMEPHLGDGSLIRVLRAFELPPVPISVLYVPTRNPSPAARALATMLKQQLAAKA